MALSCLPANMKRKKYAANHERSKDKERYYRTHRYQLALAWGARDRLEYAGIIPEKMDVSELQQKYNQLKADSFSEKPKKEKG